jgi:hypothetical protein
MSQYILPLDLTGEKQRLKLMSELLDPLHRSCIEQVGLQVGSTARSRRCQRHRPELYR